MEHTPVILLLFFCYGGYSGQRATNTASPKIKDPLSPGSVQETMNSLVEEFRGTGRGLWVVGRAEGALGSQTWY